MKTEARERGSFFLGCLALSLLACRALTGEGRSLVIF
jgi:hypothetical protein